MLQEDNIKLQKIKIKVNIFIFIRKVSYLDQFDYYGNKQKNEDLMVSILASIKLKINGLILNILLIRPEWNWFEQ